ncbi:MAG: Flagellar brake protein YcgR [ANME-2 cluster archaeon]|nr:Flagellar brake protein YcgR [ANME-2 cluster archaeon]
MLSDQQYGMKVQKSFVKTNDTASIRCPACALVKNITVGKFRGTRHTLKTRCSCGSTFLVALDFRKHYRKPTSLWGMYSLIGSSSHGGGQMQVNNISRGGLAFTVSGQHSIHVGQQALLNFKLDDKKQTELTKKVIVKNIQNNSIGCEFLNHNQIGKDLGFYLRP